MGQMTHAVMYGVSEPRLPKGKSWYGDSVEVNGEWKYRNGLLEDFKPGRGPRPDTPSGDSEDHVVGFWVAVGASGERGVPDLGRGFPLDDFLSVKAYRKSYDRAKKAWAKFALFCRAQGVKLPKPRLWLVETEVA